MEEQQTKKGKVRLENELSQMSQIKLCFCTGADGAMYMLCQNVFTYSITGILVIILPSGHQYVHNFMWCPVFS